MRPIDSSYDRTMARSSAAASEAIAAMAGGRVLGYDDPHIEALDDAAWAEIRERIVEVPGEGWKILG